MWALPLRERLGNNVELIWSHILRNVQPDVTSNLPEGAKPLCHEVVVVEEEKAGSMDYYIYEALEKFPSVFGGHFKLIMSPQKEKAPYAYKRSLVCYVECASSSYWSLIIRLLC